VFVRFEWDADKAVDNLAKHKVSFDEAVTAFDDPLFIVFADPDHSIQEERFIMMGEADRGRLLVVVYTKRPKAIRLISARKATRKERKAYEEEL
jgi:uncharacterized protein